MLPSGMMPRVDSKTPENLRGLEVGAVARRMVRDLLYRKAAASETKGGCRHVSYTKWEFPKGRHGIMPERSHVRELHSSS